MPVVNINNKQPLQDCNEIIIHYSSCKQKTVMSGLAPSLKVSCGDVG